MAFQNKVIIKTIVGTWCLQRHQQRRHCELGGPNTLWVAIDDINRQAVSLTLSQLN